MKSKQYVFGLHKENVLTELTPTFQIRLCSKQFCMNIRKICVWARQGKCFSGINTHFSNVFLVTSVSSHHEFCRYWRFKFQTWSSVCIFNSLICLIFDRVQNQNLRRFFILAYIPPFDLKDKKINTGEIQVYIYPKQFLCTWPVKSISPTMKAQHNKQRKEENSAFFGFLIFLEKTPFF